MEFTDKQAYIGLVLLALVFLALSLSAISQKGLTNDEIVHITAGYSYLKTGDFRLNTEHPPLIKEISAVPLLAISPNFPIKDAYWLTNKEWELSQKFFFVYNQNAEQILWYSRVPMAFIALIGLIFIFLWAKELYGNKSALLASFLYALSPSMLAHAPLVTTDMGLMLFTLVTCYYMRKFFAHKTSFYLWASGISVGLMFASKFSAIYMLPGFLLMAISHEYSVRENKRFWELKSFWALGAWLLIIGVIGIVVILLLYGILGFPSYFIGLWRVILHGEMGHRAFLMGAHSETGWLSYFTIAFLVKEPIPLLILIVIGAIATYRLWKKEMLHEELFLLIPVLVYFIGFSIGRIDIGIRHLFPIYPFLMIWLSKSANLDWKKWVKITLFIILLGWYAYDTVSIYPDYLSYFNEFVGPDNGYNILMDSNLDWGQDLKPLAKYIHDNGDPRFKIAYFGTDSREYYNISYDELKCGPSTGLIAISANMLNGFTDIDAKCSAWLKAHKPFKTIGHSIFLYNITEDQIISQREAYCKDKCKEKCKQEKLMFAGSVFNETCKCDCV